MAYRRPLVERFVNLGGNDLPALYCHDHLLLKPKLELK